MAKKEKEIMLANQVHDGRYYDRSKEEEYRSDVNVDANSKPVPVPKSEPKTVPKPESKPDVKCKYCGNSYHYKGIYSHQARCPEKPKNGAKEKKPAWKEVKDLDFSILEELEKMHPDVVEMIDAEQIKSTIIKEIKKKRKENEGRN